MVRGSFLLGVGFNLVVPFSRDKAEGKERTKLTEQDGAVRRITKVNEVKKEMID